MRRPRHGRFACPAITEANKISIGGAANTLLLATLGWIDPRG